MITDYNIEFNVIAKKKEIYDNNTDNSIWQYNNNCQDFIVITDCNIEFNVIAKNKINIS